MLHTRLLRIFIGIALGLAGAGLWLLALAALPAEGAPAAAPIVVNSNVDFPDAHPGDGVCETFTGNGICTLRAALQEAAAQPGPDVVQLQANTIYQLSQPAPPNTALFGDMSLLDSQGGDLDITDSVTLLGAGPASTIIDGNGAVIGDRVFQITGTVVISGVTIEHGQGQNIGGGLANYFRLTLVNSIIFSNTATNINNWGGGLYNAGWLTISHSSILSNATGNSNAYGGGIYNQGPMLIVDSLLSGNTTQGGSGSSGEGGGLFNIGFTSTVRNSTISGNGGMDGGGIYKGGYPLFVINSTVSGNRSNDSGGGLYIASGSTQLVNSTIADNISAGSGGGLYTAGGSAQLINSTVVGNGSGGSGGGVYGAGGATNLYNVTLAQNTANSDNSGGGDGGGVANGASSTLSFANSLIAHNYKEITMHPFPELDDDDCAGTVASQGYSLLFTVDTNTCTVAGDYTLADPLLGPLQNNGGPTLTQALLPGSPAIDGGNPSGCTDNVGALLTTDQRGRGRPTVMYGRCDIGAFEFPFLLRLPLVRR